MTTDDFNRHAAARRAAIARGEIHPASLTDLARDRLRRIAEARDATRNGPGWRAQHDSAEAAARAVLTEGIAATATFNAARAR